MEAEDQKGLGGAHVFLEKNVFGHRFGGLWDDVLDVLLDKCNCGMMSWRNIFSPRFPFLWDVFCFLFCSCQHLPLAQQERCGLQGSYQVILTSQGLVVSEKKKAIGIHSSFWSPLFALLSEISLFPFFH